MNSIHTYILPMLFKKTSTGKIQSWYVHVKGTTIVTRFGQVGGKMQTTSDPIKEGKNIGRDNETTAREQACKEAKAMWTKKKKSGYVEDAMDAEADKTDDVIEGGVLPMLAKKYEDVFNDKYFELYTVQAQPKLDGIRCIAMHEGGITTLWSRTRKRITSCPHIEDAINKICYDKDIGRIIFDGELYCNKYSKDFEKIVSAVRKKDPSEEAKMIDYHIYDLASEEPDDTYWKRNKKLINMGLNKYDHLELVDTVVVRSLVGINDVHEKFVGQGYEGAMIRISSEGYENTRSKQLLKLKTFEDAEFKIIGVEEGRGKLAGHAGAFVCETSKGKKFNVKMSGDTEMLRHYLEKFARYKGKQITVKYQGLTSDQIPRFPVGIRIRDEDL